MRFYNVLTAQRELDVDPSPDREKVGVLSEVRNLVLRKVREICVFLERKIGCEVVPTGKLNTIQLASGLCFMQEVLKKG